MPCQSPWVHFSKKSVYTFLSQASRARYGKEAVVIRSSSLLWTSIAEATMKNWNRTTNAALEHDFQFLEEYIISVSHMESFSHATMELQTSSYVTCDLVVWQLWI